jgi:uncharacterized membrane protein
MDNTDRETIVAHRSEALTVKEAPTWTVWLMRALAVTALGICCYLGYHALTASKIVGCSGDGLWDCDHVLTSRWSNVAGLPVSVPAGAVYVVMLLGLALVGRRYAPAVRQWAWAGVTFAAVSAAAAALWFISLQALVLQHFCAYCMTAHTIGIVLCVLVFWLRPLPGTWTSAFSSVAIMGILGLITSQLVSEPPQTYAIETYESADSTEQMAGDVDAGVFAPSDEEGLFESPDAFEAPTDAVQPTSTVEPAVEQAVGDAVALAPVAGAPIPSPTPLPQEEQEAQSAEEANGAQGEAASEEAESAEAEEEAAAEPPKQDRLESYLGGRIRLNTHHWPIVGDPDAKHVLVELFDYTCPHCRTMNQHLQVARQRFGDNLAILTLPVPLNSNCNSTVSVTKQQHFDACELGRLAVAVWRLDPDQFEDYHNWLFENPQPRSAGEARRKAEEMVGAEALRTELQKPIAGKFITQHVELYRRADAGTIPKLLFTHITIKGEMRSADELCNLLQRELKIAPSVAGP